MIVAAIPFHEFPVLVVRDEFRHGIVGGDASQHPSGIVRKPAINISYPHELTLTLFWKPTPPKMVLVRTSYCSNCKPTVGLKVQQY